MKIKYWFTIALLLTALSFTLQAGTVDLFGRGWTNSIGDAATGQGTYTNADGFDSTADTPSGTQMVVGGQYSSALSHAIVVSAWVGQLGITMGQLNAVDPGLGIANGSAIYYSNVQAAVGDTLTVWMNFVANDNVPYDDFAFFSASSPGLLIPDVVMLGRVNCDPTQGGSDFPIGVCEMGSSGYHAVTYKFTADGSYTLGFGVVNAVQTAVLITEDPSVGQFDSALLLDLAAPEPSSWLLAGSALLGAALLRRRRAARLR